MAGKTTRILVILILILIGIRLALPSIVRNYVNRTLAQVGDYSGHVEDISMKLWRGAYQAHGVKIEKTSGKVPEPFFESPNVEFSIQWSEIFHGALVGEIAAYQPKLHFVRGPSKEESQLSIQKEWIDKVKSLLPFRINHFDVHQGEIYFSDTQKKPPITLYIQDVEMTASNLTNSRMLSKTLAASLTATGRTYGNAPLWLKLDFDPYNPQPTFQLAASLERVDLTKLNHFLKAYGNFDVSAGTFSAYTELNASDGRFKGYVKPMFWNLQIIQWGEKQENVLEAFWEAIVAGIAEILENQPKDQLATVIPLSGELKDPGVDLWSTIGNLLKNAFIRALLPRLEGAAQEK